MAESVIIDENELPLFKEVEYRAPISESSSGRTIFPLMSAFVDKDGNQYSPTLPGGYNVIGFSNYVENVNTSTSTPGSIKAKTAYCGLVGIRMRVPSENRMVLAVDRRGNSGTISNGVMSVMAFYLRAPVVTDTEVET